MKNLLIIILLLTPILHCPAESRISRHEWQETVKDADYTEDYKEFKPKSRNKPVRRNTEIKSRTIPSGLIITIVSVLLILMIILLVYNLNGSPMARKVKAKKSQEISEIDDPEKFSMDELDKYLAEAIQKKDYRLAIRIHFLMTMKSLKENELIVWKKDKTNFDYLMELSKQDFIETFRQLVKVFEKIWYAEYEINQDQYQKLSLEYHQLRTKLKN